MFYVAARRSLSALLALVLFGAVLALTVRQLQTRSRETLAKQRRVWEVERQSLEDALAGAEARARWTPAAPAPLPRGLGPAELVAELRKVGQGGAGPGTLRRSVYLMEEIAKAGLPALPPIRDALADADDTDLDVRWLERGRWRERLPGDFVVPPSVRFALFEVARQAGGPEAEKLLAEVHATTRRGVELAYLTRVLEEASPGKYREQALDRARALLAEPTASGRPASPLDRFHRDHLFSVLAFYQDPSFVTQAQDLVVSERGLDRGALAYLKRALGRQVVPLAAKAYADPRLTEPARKEPLARAALDYVGIDDEAEAVWRKAIDDPAMPPEHRQNLIEDLNENGFPDPEHPTARDLGLIEKRIALIDRLAPSAMDAANDAAFKEARKDLVEMQKEASGQ